MVRVICRAYYESRPAGQSAARGELNQTYVGADRSSHLLLTPAEMAAEVVDLIVPAKLLSPDSDLAHAIKANEKRSRKLARALGCWTSISPHPVSVPTWSRSDATNGCAGR